MTAYDDAVLADLPVGYYKGDETSGTTAADSSGNAHPGSYGGGYTLGEPSIVPSQSGKSFRVGASSGGVLSVLGDPWMVTALAGPFAHELWVRFNTLRANGGIAGRFENGSGAQDGLLWLDLSAQLQGNWHFTSGYSRTTPVAVVAGRTYHVVQEYDGTNLNLYVNKVLVASAAASGAAQSSSSQHFNFGAYSNTSFYSDAWMQKCALYDHALGPARVAAHYAAGIGTYPGAVLADSPLVYWKFDEGSGTTPSDSSGNARSGSLYGTAAPGHTSLLADGSGKSLGLAGGASRLSQASWMETPNFTYETILKPNGIGGKQVIFGRDDLSGDPHTRHSVLYLDGSQLWASISSGTTTWQDGLSAGGAVVDGTTYHVALTFDGATLKAYLNGSLCATTISTGGAAVNLTSGMEIAVGFSSGFGGIWWFQGDVDEFAYYGTALTAARIAGHYAAASATSVSAATAAGTYLYAGTSTGKAVRRATAVGAYVWAGTAVGAKPAIATKQGAATGGYLWAGTATGAKPAPILPKQGTATGGYRWAGTAAGSNGNPPPAPPITNHWTLTEKATGATWTMPTNPNTMSGLPMTKQLATVNWTRQGDRRLRTFQSRTTAEPFEWSGVILTAQHYQDLYDWSRKPGVIVVTDHLQRSFEVIVQSFVPDTKPGRRAGDPKRTYKMSTLFLRRLP